MFEDRPPPTRTGGVQTVTVGIKPEPASIPQRLGHGEEVHRRKASNRGSSATPCRRGEIAGVIARIEQQLGQFRADLVHLTAAAHLFWRTCGSGFGSNPFRRAMSDRRAAESARRAAAFGPICIEEDRPD